MAVKDPKILAAITAAISAYLAEEWRAVTAAEEAAAVGYVEFRCPQCGYMKKVALS